MLSRGPWFVRKSRKPPRWAPHMRPGWQLDSSKILTNSLRIGLWTAAGNRTWTQAHESGSITSGKKQSRAALIGQSSELAARVAFITKREITMHGPFLGEFMGTLVLIALGDGVVANVLLKKSKGENSGWIVIATAWGMAVVAGICTAIACGSPGAHINPAITLAVEMLSKDWTNVGTFWAAQFLGGFVGERL